MDQLLDAVEWEQLPPFVGDGLHATHEGYLDIMGMRLKCYVLSDGQRVFDADEVALQFGLGT